MEPSRFEDKIREKLEGLNPEYNPDSWHQLEEKMQAKADSSLDQKVKEELGAMSESYDDASWSVLLGRLKQWESLRREFYILRAGEMLILALLFLTFHQYAPLLESDQNATTDIVVVEQETSIESLGSLEKPLSLEVEQDYREGKESHLIPEALIGNLEGSNTGNTGSSDRAALIRQEEGPVSSLFKFVNDESAIADLESNESDIAGQDLELTYNELTSEVLQQVKERPYDVGFQTQGLLSIPFLSSLEGGVANDLDVGLPVVTITGGYGQKNGDRNVWMTILSHSSLNQVRTPADNEFAENNAYTSGYGFGLLFGFESGRFTWETGAEYEFGIFRPRRTKLTGNITVGYGSTTLSEINVDYINIPLQTRVEIWERYGHSFYAVAGLKLHVSSKVDFDFVEEDGSFDLPGDFKLGDEPEEIHSVVGSRFTYVTLNAGFGYQKQLNRHTKLFIQPSFEYFAEKRGIVNLNNEKVNTIRLDFGVRIGL
jgi:hypothetical protein